MCSFVAVKIISIPLKVIIIDRHLATLNKQADLHLIMGDDRLDSLRFDMIFFKMNIFRNKVLITIP